MGLNCKMWTGNRYTRWMHICRQQRRARLDRRAAPAPRARARAPPARARVRPCAARTRPPHACARPRERAARPRSRASAHPPLACARARAARPRSTRRRPRRARASPPEPVGLPRAGRRAHVMPGLAASRRNIARVAWGGEVAGAPRGAKGPSDVSVAPEPVRATRPGPVELLGVSPEPIGSPEPVGSPACLRAGARARGSPARPPESLEWRVRIGPPKPRQGPRVANAHDAHGIAGACRSP